MEVSIKPHAVLIRLAALVVVLVLLTVFINLSWFDEALHPDLRRLLPPQPVSMEDNAFPLIYGFGAAQDRDPREAGLAIVSRLRQAYANGSRITLSDAELDTILGDRDTGEGWRETFPSLSCNARFEIDCADRLIADATGSDGNDARLSRLLDRYETILRAPHFAENQEFDASTPIPDYGSLMDIARIRLALAYRDKTTPAFLNAVSADIAFWKLMLRDGQSLIAKMVALAGLRNDTTFISTLLRDRPPRAADIQTVERILTPLTEPERNIGETFLAELRISLLSSKSLALILDGPPAITRLALQEQATLNEYYFTTTIPLQLRAGLTAPEFFRQNGHEPLNYQVRVMPPPLYNLGGKFILKWMASEMSAQDYISRVHDLDGRIALTLLHAEIALDPERPAETVIRTSRYRNPYTGAPMSYDHERQTIGFECLANEDDVCALALGDRGR